MTKRIKCPQCQHAFSPADAADRGNTDGANTDADVAITTSIQDERGLGRRRTPIATTVRWLAGSLLLTGFVIFTIYLATRRPAVRPRPMLVPSATEPPASSTEGLAPQVGKPLAPLEQVLDSLEYGVVKIEAEDLQRASSLGSGFVIDAGGLIATNYHVLSEATEARVRFKDGLAYDIAGYVAVDPDHDLAIVKLSRQPADLEVLPLRHADDPRRLSSVIAIGHPYGVQFSPVDGKVSRVLNTEELPGHARQFLREMIGGNTGHRWIQHTARLSEGNSGGPLVNERGEVIGINTWVDKNTSFGYALHARHLHELKRRSGDEVTPLRQHAKPQARMASFLRNLSTQRVKQLMEDAEAMNWRPADAAAYESLQQMAWAVTVAHSPHLSHSLGRQDDQKWEELIRATDQVVARLSDREWDQEEQVRAVNERALDRLHHPMAGVFLFADVARVVSGDDDRRGVLMQVAGAQQMLFVPLEGQLFNLEPGSLCLLLGVNYDGRVVRYGDNPLQLIAAPIIASRTILPVRR